MSAQTTGVLAVMEEAQSRLFGASSCAADIAAHDAMIEARATVAELITAADLAQLMLPESSAIRRDLRAALAKARGGA